MEGVGIFYGVLVHFTAILYIVWPFGIFYWLFGIFSPALVYCTNRNLATLIQSSVVLYLLKNDCRFQLRSPRRGVEPTLGGKIRVRRPCQLSCPGNNQIKKITWANPAAFKITATTPAL
jgi:hypothetical protein